MTKDPAFLFYSQDFLVGTMTMSFEDRGKYITILALMHQKGSISEAEIDALTGGISDTLKNKFKIDENGRFFNKKLSDEMKRRIAFRKKQKDNGKLGGRPKLTQKKPKRNPSHNPKQSLSASASASVSAPVAASKKVPLSSELDPVTEIFSFWKVELNHPAAILSADRKRAIKARLTEGYTVERIKAAIRGIKNSPHNMGDNDRGKIFDEIELICRKGSHVDRFADMDGEDSKGFHGIDRYKNAMIPTGEENAEHGSK